MTIIVWDGTTLAADRQETSGSRMTEASKIYKREFNGELITGSGRIAAVAALRHWYLYGSDPGSYPSCQKSNDDWGRLVVITDDRRVLVYESEPIPYEVQYLPVVFGSGADFAAGALAMGANAKQTVEIVNCLCTDCGLGMDYAQPGLTDTDDGERVQWL